MMFCDHCGSDGHTADNGCTVKEATERILANYTPRGMTTGFVCPNCETDGVWNWGPGSRFFVCQRCGAEVGHEKMAVIHAEVQAQIRAEEYYDGKVSTEVSHSHRPSWSERWRRRLVHLLRADDEHDR